MFSKKQLEPPTDKQMSYIEALERKTGLTFHGTTKREANKFIDKGNQIAAESKLIKYKMEREDERFPFPNLKDDLPSDKQWAYIRSLEEKTKLKFKGITKKDASEFIDIAKQLIQVLPDKMY